MNNNVANYPAFSKKNMLLGLDPSFLLLLFFTSIMILGFSIVLKINMLLIIPLLIATYFVSVGVFMKKPYVFTKFLVLFSIYATYKSIITITPR